MGLWIAMAVLTAAAAAALLAPMYRSRRDAAAAPAELAIYRDQLDEVDRDVRRGILPAGEATAARNEIARRLLQAGEPAPGEAAPKSRLGALASAAPLVVLPVVALGGYLWLGSPSEPDMPRSARLAAFNPDDPPAFDAILTQGLQGSDEDAKALVTELETKLKAEPDNPVLWWGAAVMYARVGRMDDAGVAYVKASPAVTRSADAEGSFGTQLGVSMFDLHGQTVMTPETVAVFRAVLANNPANVNARVYVAAYETAHGNHDAAVAEWKAVLASDPSGRTPWADIARKQLAALEPGSAPRNGGGLAVEPAPPASTPPAPTQEEVDAAAAMTPEERQAMVGSMVDRLATRLEQQPDDAAGWAQLLKSYMVLGRTDDARAALARARVALAEKPDALAAVEAAAKSLELP
jgi:cytochrome c-type biogenesis protein CcmH